MRERGKVYVYLAYIPIRKTLRVRVSLSEKLVEAQLPFYVIRSTGKGETNTHNLHERQYWKILDNELLSSYTCTQVSESHSLTHRKVNSKALHHTGNWFLIRQQQQLSVTFRCSHLSAMRRSLSEVL